MAGRFRWVVPVLGLAAVACGCRERPGAGAFDRTIDVVFDGPPIPPAPDADEPVLPPAASDASRETPDAPAIDAAGEPGDPGAPATDEPTEPPPREPIPTVETDETPYALPLALSPLPGGARVVWARPAGDDASEILIRRLGPDGEVAGPPRVLRKTSGAVRAIDAARVGPDTAVVWCAPRPDGTVVYGAARVDDEDRRVGTVVTLGVERGGWGSEEGCSVAAVGRDDSVVVVRSAGTTRCRHETDLEDCPGVAVETIGPDGTVGRLARGGVLAPAGPLRSPLVVDGRLIFALPETHIAVKTFVISVGLPRPGEEPTEEPPPCRGLDGDVHCCGTQLGALFHLRAVLGWDGETLAALDPGSVEGESPIALWPGARCPEEDEESGGPVAESLPVLQARRFTCSENGLAIALTDARGRRVQLDPNVPEASFRPHDFLPPREGAAAPAIAAAWTGRVLVAAWPSAYAVVGDPVDLVLVPCRGGRPVF